MLPQLYLTPQLHEMFWELDKIYHFTGTEMRLYYYLVRVWAGLNGKRRFWHRDEEVSAGAGCSENTMRKYRKRLADAGLITFISGGKNYAEKTRYELCFAPENLNGEQPTRKRYTDEEADIAKLAVSETGMVVKAEAKGLTLLVKSDETVSAHNLSQSTQIMSASPQNFSPLVSSSYSEEKKTEKTETVPVVSSSQAALFQEERPTPPEASEIYAFIEEILVREKGDVPLTTIDRELIHAVAQKFLAAKACSDWRDDKSQKCMILYWKERLTRYYHSAKWGTRSDIQRAYNTEASARAIQKAAEERTAYIKRRQEEQAAELAQKAADVAQKQEFNMTAQARILAKIENTPITLVNRSNHGNAQPNRTTSNRNNPTVKPAGTHKPATDDEIRAKLESARAERLAQSAVAA